MHSIVIHGGAGVVRRDRYSAEEIKAYEAALRECRDAGFEVLAKGGSAIEAVTEAVMALEDCPLFNAGRGSVLAANGRVQMDASLMCGATRKSGGVTLLEKVRNPILAARLVMEKTQHRLIGGHDAEELAKEHGLKLEDPSYFLVAQRIEQLKKAKAQGAVELDHAPDKKPELPDSNTVGAVALDDHGNLAAATSTGGLTNKLPGRISDSSVIGAGTFADNSTLAISSTGTGDIFIRNSLAHDAHALMKYLNLSLPAACERGLRELKDAGGEGGVIALTRAGEIYLGFNTDGMFRAVRNSKGRSEVACFGE